MILNEKAKEDFINYIDSDDLLVEGMSNIYRNALIIDWFDSVGIYIEIIRNEGYFDYLVHEEWDYGFETRQEATKQAIIKANEIYNERK